MKVSIITPTYNNSRFIAATINSIKNQAYKNFEHIIVDGGSDHETMDIVNTNLNNYPCRYIREKDNGMYDAINKGFDLASGDIYCWVNSDDLLDLNALSHVVTVFTENKHVDWLQGISAYIDEEGFITSRGRTLTYIRQFIRMGYYGRFLHFVHQASGFWRKCLWEKAGGISGSLKLAGDYELWIKFSQFASLYSTPVTLAYFRHHAHQLSCQVKAYRAECEQIRHLTLVDRYLIKYFLKLLHPFITCGKNELRRRQLS